MIGFTNFESMSQMEKVKTWNRRVSLRFAGRSNLEYLKMGCLLLKILSIPLVSKVDWFPVDDITFDAFKRWDIDPPNDLCGVWPCLTLLLYAFLCFSMLFYASWWSYVLTMRSVHCKCMEMHKWVWYGMEWVKIPLVCSPKMSEHDIKWSG